MRPLNTKIVMLPSRKWSISYYWREEEKITTVKSLKHLTHGWRGTYLLTIRKILKLFS